MTKQSGYNIIVKAFIPSSKTDYKAQARAATTMDELMSGKVITHAFVELARILDVSGKYGSAELPAEPLPDIDPADMEGGEEGETSGETEGQTETSQTGRQKRSSPKA